MFPKIWDRGYFLKKHSYIFLLGHFLPPWVLCSYRHLHYSIVIPPTFPRFLGNWLKKKNCAATTFSISISVTKQRTSFFWNINLLHLTSIKMKWIFAKVKLQYMAGKTCQKKLKLLGLYRKVTHTTYCSQVLFVKPNPINVSPVIYTRRVPVM